MKIAMRKIIALAVCLSLALSAGISGAFAADASEYGLYMEGVPVTASESAGNGWNFDASEGKLTLSGAQLSARSVSGAGAAAIWYEGSSPLTIELNGGNYLVPGESQSDCFGIVNLSGKRLTFTGVGTLSIEAGDTGTDGAGSYGIYSNQSVEIGPDAEVSAHSGRARFCSYGIYISPDNGGELAVKGTFSAISASADGIQADSSELFDDNLSAAVCCGAISVGSGVCVFMSGTMLSDEQAQDPGWYYGQRNVSFEHQEQTQEEMTQEPWEVVLPEEEEQWTAPVSDPQAPWDVPAPEQGDPWNVPIPQPEWPEWQEPEMPVISMEEPYQEPVYEIQSTAPILIDTITILPNLEMTVGETIQLTAEIMPYDATNPAIVWGATDSSVVTVSENGAVTAIAEGMSYVYAVPADASGAKSNLCTVTVVSGTKYVESVTIPSTLTLTVGDVLQLTAETAPYDATDSRISWGVSGDGISVDENGAITATAEGTGYVFAAAADQGGARSNICTVTVLSGVKRIESIAIPSELTLTEGESVQLTAEIMPYDATDPAIVWGTTDGSVVTVSENGVVTAVAAGSGCFYAVPADASGAKSNDCTVTVNKAVKRIESISIKPSLTLTEGETYQLTAEIFPADATDPKIIWGVAGSGVTVSENGLVTAVTGGSEAYVYAVPADASGAEYNVCTVTVNVAHVPATGITASMTDIPMVIGDEANVTVEILPEKAEQNYEISVSDNRVISVEKSGNTLKIAALAKGNSTVIISSRENARISTTVKVAVSEPISPVESIRMSLDRDTAAPGGTVEARVTVKPDSATDKSYYVVSSNVAVATVPYDPDTLVRGGSFTITAVNEGQSVIRVICASDVSKYYDCTLTVEKAVVPVKGISAVPQSDKIKIGETIPVSVKILPVDATDTSYRVLSGNPSVVRVPDEVLTGASFKLTGLKSGTATVTVSSVGDPKKSYSFNITVETGTVYVREISVDERNVTLSAKGSYKDLTVSALPENATNRQMTAAVADQSVASLSYVNGKLRINAVGKGTTTVTLSANDGSGTTSTVYVTVGGETPITSIQLVNANGAVTTAEKISRIGNSFPLLAYVTPTNATNTAITWTSSNPYVAYVTPVNGQYNVAQITAYSNGTAVITAYANDGSGKYAQCTVTVYEGTAANYSITYKDNSGTWYYDYPTTFTVKANGPLNAFTSASIDGVGLNSAYYTRSGDASSTTVTLSSACMQTLSPGRHTLTLTFNNGQTSASTYIFVQSVRDVPRTGDDGYGSALFLLGLSLAGMAGCALTAVRGKKKKFNVQ